MKQLQNQEEDLSKLHDTDTFTAQVIKLARSSFHDLSVSGEVIFGARGSDYRLDVSTWCMDDSVYLKLKESGFRDGLLRLLDQMMTLRASENMGHFRDGVVRINNLDITIEWLDRETAECLLEEERRMTV